ncbi:F-box/LRR-repeat protein [Acorus gramineus]|uniref:F-box/LRR-repeat protein n=1 Tax=Acorus gramineus TaxID=55184 RepID=A0AAV9B357_ACOGR|nr:F-box/LRR-repeat protein [Acorus gramineus]
MTSSSSIPIHDDLLEMVLSVLPAADFARASCVSRSWRRLCDRALHRRGPRLVSYVSVKPNIQDAVLEAIDGVFSEPMRPHFAIACVDGTDGLEFSHSLVRAKLGGNVPLITCKNLGFTGCDPVSKEVKEIPYVEVGHGVLLIVGFLPGLNVDVIPLLKAKKEALRETVVDSFINEIKSCTGLVSDHAFPTGVIMFSDFNADIRFMLEQMDQSLNGGTPIAGGKTECFIFSNGDGSRSGGSVSLLSLEQRRLRNRRQANQSDAFDAVALVFARHRIRPHGVGEIHFNLALSSGLFPIGSMYKASSVRVINNGPHRCITRLTARREGSSLELDGERLMLDFLNEVESGHLNTDIYIGVTKERKHLTQSDTSFAIHEVICDDEHLDVDGCGIHTGDTFCFYTPDSETALTSRSKAFEKLGPLEHRGTNIQAFGGLIFGCCGRDRYFLGEAASDCMAFVEKFPGVPFGGMLFCGEIARRPVDGENPLRRPQSLLNFYTTVYLLMSYAP